MDILINGTIKAEWWGRDCPTVRTVRAALSNLNGRFFEWNPGFRRMAGRSYGIVGDNRPLKIETVEVLCDE